MWKSIVFTLTTSFILIHFGDAAKSVCDTISDNGRIRLEWFDTTHKICCNNKISQRTTNLECCSGQHLYFSNSEICCKGKVSERWVSKKNGQPNCDPEEPYCKERMCCGNQLVSKQDHFCCGGKIIELFANQVSIRDYLGCCGETNFDRRYEVCCGNSILQRNETNGCCNNIKFDKGKFKCIHNRIMKKTERFCGRGFYDAVNDKCCDEHVIKGVPEIVKDANRGYKHNLKIKCCGKKVMDRDNELCCYNYGFPSHSIPNHRDIYCCGSGSLNITTHECINGKPHIKPPNHVLCGNVFINTSYQACCANKKPYNIFDEKCCEGASFCVIKQGQSCCNGYGMREDEICCENIKPCKKRHSDDDNCCFDFKHSSGQTYRTKRETCYNGEILQIPEGTLPCGYNDYINPNQSFCCQEKKYKIGNGQCCNGIYSSISEEEGRCCYLDSGVYKIDDQRNPCLLKCNKKQYYDETHELCCQGRKFESIGNNYCCGPYAINPQEMSCCGNQFPYRLYSRKKCCNHRQIYNERHSHCSPDGKVEVKSLQAQTDVQKLCYKLTFKLFDGGFQHACLRDYAIIGKIDKINTTLGLKGDVEINISIKNAKTLRRKELNFSKKKTPREMEFVIHMTDVPHNCSFDYLKQMIHRKKVIVLFDSKHVGEIGKVIEITQNSPFFLTPGTYYRRYTVSKAVSEYTCSFFS